MATYTTAELEQTLAKLDLHTPVPQFALADVANKPLDVCRSYLADILCSLVECDHTNAYNSIQLSNDPLHGDVTIVLPKLRPGSKADQLAFDLIKKFPATSLFGLPWADGVYLRVCFEPKTLPRVLVPFIRDRKNSYGIDSTQGLKNISVPSGAHKKAVVEFSSPNIASEFQGKHMRSTIIGAFVSTMLECHGWEVTRVNYLGDWGKDLALLAVGWEKFGSEETFEQDPVAHLLDVYHKIHEMFLPEAVASKAARDEAKKKNQNELEITAEIESKGLFAERNDFFKRMEDGDEKAVALCKRIREVNIDNYTKFYARLGITFEEYYGESKVSQETMCEIEQLLKDKGISEESGGAWVIDMKKHGAKAGTAIVRDRTGSGTYFLRYLAAIVDRSRSLEFDKMIFVASDRTGHFSRLFKVIELLDMSELASKLEHVSFNDVSHMIEKLGHGHQPHSILNDCEAAMLTELKANEAKAAVLGDSEDTSKTVGITALLAQELSTKKTSDHAFDLKSMTSFKSGSGPDLQYWYARLCSILEAHPTIPELPNEDYGELDDEDQTSFLVTLGQYPEVVSAAYKTLEPATIMTYLHNVVESLSGLLDDEEEEEIEVEGEGSEETLASGDEADTEETGKETITPAQAALYEAARIVLENGMRLLGLTPLNRSDQSRVDTPVE